MIICWGVVCVKIWESKRDEKKKGVGGGGGRGEGNDLCKNEESDFAFIYYAKGKSIFKILLLVQQSGVG